LYEKKQIDKDLMQLGITPCKRAGALQRLFASFTSDKLVKIVLTFCSMNTIRLRKNCMERWQQIIFYLYRSCS